MVLGYIIYYHGFYSVITKASVRHTNTHAHTQYIGHEGYKIMYKYYNDRPFRATTKRLKTLRKRVILYHHRKCKIRMDSTTDVV